MKAFYLLIVAAGVTACATLGPPVPGNYVETRGPGVVIFTSKELHLRRNQTFDYFQWSDDLGSSKYGTGKYQLVKKKLRLTFEPQLPVVSLTQAQPLVAVPVDSLVFSFLVKGAATATQCIPMAIPFATIIAYNANNQLVAGISCDAAGRATLRIARAAQPHVFKVSNVGFLNWEQACPAASTAYQLELQEDAGTPYATGTVIEFRVIRQTSKQLVLGQGKYTTVFISQPVCP